ncbi:pqqC-like protein [alpha proteobacterium U9-1i]|nr:pqqC-like protein [alpha proteobacterium U9-1i]
MLAENLSEEEGLSDGHKPHAALWLDFARGIGAEEAQVRATIPRAQTKNLIDTFLRLSRQSYPAALGALYAYESQMPDVALTKIKGLQEFYGARDETATRFFAVHASADVEHADVCRALLNQLTDDDAEEAVSAALELSNALLGFLDGALENSALAA